MKQNAVLMLVSLGCRLGEGPLWHPGERMLYGVDIEGKSIWRVNPINGVAQHYPIGFRVGCLGLRDQGGFVLAGEQGFATWEPVTGEIIWAAQIETPRAHTRFNDGSVGPGGRFWAGMMSPEGFENNLYRLDPDLNYHIMETGMGISNGIGWSPDRSTMYFTDSARKVICAYDFDSSGGTIENRRTWVDSGEEVGVPDGLCVDSDGCVWSARWDGWCVARYDPQGKLMATLPMPVQRPTSCAFGGDEMKTLFITSAWIGLTENERQAQPLAGDLFAVDCDTPGQVATFFAG